MSSPRPTGRRRRPTSEIRARILDAARELFVTQGYDATTGKDIAARAEVHERLVFTNFGTKADLFTLSVAEPFLEMLRAYVDSYNANAAALSPDRRIEHLVDGLFDLAKQDQILLLSSIARRRLAGGDATGPDIDLLDEVARNLQRLKAYSLDSEEYADLVDRPSVIAAAMGMIFGVVLLEDLMFPAGTRKPGRARLTAELRTMLTGRLHSDHP